MAYNCINQDFAGEDLVFLHQVQAGGASRSYGIEAARLAGLPNTIVRSAKSSRHHGQYAQK